MILSSPRGYVKGILCRGNVMFHVRIRIFYSKHPRICLTEGILADIMQSRMGKAVHARVPCSIRSGLAHNRMRCSRRAHFPSRRASRKERKVIFVKRSGKLLVTVMGIILSGSVGFGATLDVDGDVNPSHYDVAMVDVDGGGEDFAECDSG